MHRHRHQPGAAIILLLAIMSTLSVLSMSLTVVVVNQMDATARDRSSKQSLFAAEAGLDSGVQLAKSNHTVSTSSEWLTPDELAQAFAGTEFPAGATATYRVYDNLAPVNYNIKWDQGGPTFATTPDGMVWVEIQVTYKHRTTRTRCLVQQTSASFVYALPKAVLYSDTGITLNGTSDIFALNADETPDTSGAPYPTSIMAGGSWLSGQDAELGRFAGNSSTDLAAPGQSVQSLGIKANGSVSTPGHSFNDVQTGAGKVGFLSDYFDQADQSNLADASQVGGTHPGAPTAPSSWASTGFTSITSTVLNTLQSTSSTTTYTAASDLVLPTTLNSGNLTLSRGTSTTARTFTFRKLYVTGNLTLTGPVKVTCTSLHVGGTITVNNTTTTSVTDSVGPLYVAGTGASSVAGRVNLTCTSAYTGGSFTIGNTYSTALTDQFGTQLYTVGDLSVSGNISAQATSSVYGGGNITFTGPASPVVTHTFGLLYAGATGKTLTFAGNVAVKATAVVDNSNFTISGATTALTDWLGQVFVAATPSDTTYGGNVKWGGLASVTTRDYTNSTVDPKPMWMGRYFERTGTYNDEYGPIWVPGNSTTSVVFGSTGTSSVLCPILCTTEKTTVSGTVNFGTRAKPMVYFFMCDNNGIYPQEVEWGSTGKFYGLMVIMESTITIGHGGVTSLIQGSIFAGCPYADRTPSKSDITLEGASSVAYDQAIVDAVAASSIKTTTLVTQIVPGSWQQLSTTN